MKRTQPNGLEVYRRATVIPSQRWGWRLWRNGKKIAGSLEGYTDRAQAERMGHRVVSGGYGNRAINQWMTDNEPRKGGVSSYLLDGGK